MYRASLASRGKSWLTYKEIQIWCWYFHCIHWVPSDQSFTDIFKVIRGQGHVHMSSVMWDWKCANITINTSLYTLTLYSNTLQHMLGKYSAASTTQPAVCRRRQCTWERSPTNFSMNQGESSDPLMDRWIDKGVRKNLIDCSTRRAARTINFSYSNTADIRAMLSMNGAVLVTRSAQFWVCTKIWQVTLQLQTDRATRSVSRNLVICCTTVGTIMCTTYLQQIEIRS